MAGNIFGKILTLSTFGESHGEAIGGILDGMPAGLEIDLGLIQRELNRRKPGQSTVVTSRNETDEVDILSGLLDGKTLGTPIAFLVKNIDHKSIDYFHLATAYRPSHADFTYEEKYGVRDIAGGGRSSARETVARVIGGAFAKQLLTKNNISVSAYVNSIGTVSLDIPYIDLVLSGTEDSIVRCPDKTMSEKMIELINQTKNKGDTLGGEITCVIKGVPTGLGEPVFNKLNAALSHAIMSINAVKGFEIGSGFEASKMLGSEHNDLFIMKDGILGTQTNNSGGIQGGISNGNDIYFKSAFKPVSTLMMDQKTVDKDGNQVILKGKGRHDVCVVPRAVPIVEAMATLVIADHLLLNRLSKI